MPVIIDHESMPNETTGEGWVRIALADRSSIGTSAIAAYRWSFEPFAVGPETSHDNTDQLIYVISGSGTAHVNGDPLVLEKEAVLWLELGDIYNIIAGESGLEILQGYAPGQADAPGE